MVILIDADGVLEDLTQKWVIYLNEKYGTSVRYEDVTEWDMTKNFPSLTREQVYGAELDDELYERLKPYDGAVQYVKKLMDDGHTVYVVTTSPYQILKVKTEKVLLKYFPFLTWKNVIVTSDKKLIKGDILIDDGIHNLLGGDYLKILMSAPYNRDFDAGKNGMIRVHNWKEIYEIISALCGGNPCCSLNDENVIRSLYK